MKKTLIALAVLGATSSVAMASNVTLYGKVSEAVVVSKVKGEDATTQMKSGFDAGSRWGIKGVEDLGNGYKVGFVLEQGFNADNGTESSADYAFNRETSFYVAGDFGKVGVGRFGSLASGTGSYSILGGWALGTSYDAGSFNTFDGTLRVDNGVVYVAPTVGGLTISAMYSNNTKDVAKGYKFENDVAVEVKAHNDSTHKWSENDHYYGIGAQYNAGDFALNVIFEAQDNKSSDKDALYQIDLGASYNLGSVTPMFAYRYQTQDNERETHTFGLSAKAPVAGGTAKVGVRYRIEKLDGTAKPATGADDGSVWTINAAYEYKLSKRTTLWAYGGYAEGDDILDKKVEDNVSYNGYQLGVGLTHNF